MEIIGTKHIKKLPTRYCTNCRIISEDLELFCKDSSSKYGRKNMCKQCNNARNRTDTKQTKYKHKHQLAKRYNITPEEYVESMETSSVCEICSTVEALCYDHDHNTMKFRGVLCRSCNKAIGALGDDVSGVRSALTYLVKHYSPKDYEIIQSEYKQEFKI